MFGISIHGHFLDPEIDDPDDEDEDDDDDDDDDDDEDDDEDEDDEDDVEVAFILRGLATRTCSGEFVGVFFSTILSRTGDRSLDREAWTRT